MKYRVRKLNNDKFVAEKKKFFYWSSCWWRNDRFGLEIKKYTTKEDAEKDIDKLVKLKEYDKNPEIHEYIQK